MKPRIAIFSLTGCEGCSLSILELEDRLIEILETVEIVNFREGMTERSWDIDIGFVDGAVSTPDDEREIRHFRSCCKSLVAIGACACLGGVNILKNHQGENEPGTYVYGERASWFATTPARPISAIVTIDYELPGCPLVKDEFLRFMGSALHGLRFKLPDYPVCVECKKRGILCLYEKGMHCFGPIARAGCAAICPSFGSKCEACRGLLRNDLLAIGLTNLRDHYGISEEAVVRELRLYGAHT